MDADDWFTLAELTERLGALVWVEERLFELLGGWSTTEAVPSAAIYFATTARHHGWHAEIVTGCLPTSPQLLEREVVVAPTQGWQRAVAALRELSEPEATALRLRSLVKVIDPWLAREAASLIDLARPISDAAIVRWLRFAELDHTTGHDRATELLASVRANAVGLDEHLLVGELDLSR